MSRPTKKSRSVDHKKNESFDLDTLFKEWYNLKKNLSKLQEREEDIKKMVNKIMKIEKTSKLEGDDFKVEKRYQKRKLISRKDLPEDIFDKYCKEKEIEILYLKKL